MQTTGRKRNTIDKFYTKKEVADQCIELFKNTIQINQNDLIIEPAAGNGAFFGLRKLGCQTEFYDIAPEHPDILEQDFFERYIPHPNWEKGKIHVVTNPPFGRQSSAAKQFIYESAKFADTIAFILPKSFKKVSMQRIFLLCFHLVGQLDLPKNSFLIGEGREGERGAKEHDVPCVFQIWVKKDHDRELPEHLEPIGYKFVSKQDDHDVCIRRVGVNAGSVTEGGDCAATSHYFIKFEEFTKDVLRRLLLIKFPFDNTVGPKSISKQELIKEINQIL